MEKLDTGQVAAELKGVAGWSLSASGSAIERTFRFNDFDEAMRFVNRVASLAEERQHHPDILIRYNKVTLTLSTHDAGGLTGKDFALAREVSALV